jgi:hypothetical protein
VHTAAGPDGRRARHLPGSGAAEHASAWRESWAKIGAVAILLQLTVAPATRDQFNELDAEVGQSMMQAGGPPEGLMSHAVYPEGDGFVIAEVWRAEAEGQRYIDDVLRPLLAELALTGQVYVVRPVWSFARP